MCALRAEAAETASDTGRAAPPPLVLTTAAVWNLKWPGKKFNSWRVRLKGYLHESVW
jgi:hypothetical protein